MQNFYMYLCDVCGYSKEYPDVCPRCEIPLTEYSKETQKEYQINMEEAMRSMSEYKWYV
jgi:primosomal protein N'